MPRSSRDKLNSLHLGGSIAIAAAIAVLSGSWQLFVLVAAALVAASLYTGEIRAPRRR